MKSRRFKAYTKEWFNEVIAEKTFFHGKPFKKIMRNYMSPKTCIDTAESIGKPKKLWETLEN